MSCSFSEKVSSLIDGELSVVEAREVERHVLECSECEQVRADFLNLRSQITSFETALKPEVQNRALKKILSREDRATAPGLQWSFGTRSLAFASLVIVAAIIGVLVYRNSQQPRGERQIAAVVQSPSPVPSASVEASKEPESKASPEAAHGTEQQNAPAKANEENQQRRAPSAPVKRPIIREPKPGEQFASLPQKVRSADSETLTAMHFETSERLLTAFRNIRFDGPGAAAEISYERSRAQQLVYQNMILRREADTAGDVQVSSLLENLEPILIDIANLPEKPDEDAVSVIRERVERKNIVPLLRVTSTTLARALD